MQFTLLGKAIEISNGRKNYMKILTDYREMATKAEFDFKKEYEDTFGLVFLNSTWADKFKKTYGSDNYMDNIVKRYVTKTRQYLAEYGVYNLSDTVIWNEGVLNEDRGTSQLQYEFDSYVIECLKRNEDDDTFISRLKSKFSGNYFETCLYNDVMSLCAYVWRYLDDNKIAEIQFVYKKDSIEAEAIYKNLIDANIPASEQERLAHSLIELDPRQEEYYEYIFETLPQAKYEIVAIAQFLSIDLSDLIEEDIRRDFDLKYISSEDDALKMMDDLNSSMEKFCVSSSSRKTELEKILYDYDIKAKTYDGVLYDTRELRTRAEEEDKALFEMHGDVNSIDKDECNSFLKEIVHMQCAVAIRNKHLQLLNDRIIFIDHEYLENLLLALEVSDESECNRLKEVINHYDTSEETKSPYIARVEKRIYEIWDVEDFEKFTDIFVKTTVSDSQQVGKNCAYIRDTGRTETKELFIKALYLLNDTEVEAAAKYAVAKESGLFASLINMGKKETYEILTLEGRVMHPAVLSAIDIVKAKKGNGILSSLGFGKNKSKQPLAHTPPSNGVKFCSSCGAKNDGESKFCSSCGNKLN